VSIEGSVERMVNSPPGKMKPDSSGSAIGAARMDPAETYGFIAKQLQEYINSGSDSAWQKIRLRVDEIYKTAGTALDTLEAESPFMAEIKRQVSAGKKLLFKPNLVTLPLIDYKTHGPGVPGANTHWEFAAAVMRWFHDRASITYHQMAVGEAGMTLSTDTEAVSKELGRRVTPEAVMEGKYGEDYGGWGFYFTRKYLADCHPEDHRDDPFSGYRESLDGACLPPGQAADKLMLYNLNRPDEYSGRDVPVADGINFKSITIHKALIGGDRGIPGDNQDWPGCVLINLPILKIHVMELLTFALKNIGMGVYAMEARASSEPGTCKWKYSVPNVKVPFTKLKVPHRRWVLETDEDSLKPLRDARGEFIWGRTGGMEATIADGIQAVKGQNITMLHIGDAIECTNIYHSGMTGVVVPEGFVFASKDPVALDNLGARYLFNMVGMEDSEKIQKKYNIKSDIIQKTPFATQEGKNIVTVEGYDSSYSRYHALKHCEERGLGQLKFYIAGKDLREGGELASVNLHPGRIENGAFKELLTSTAYHASGKPLMDFQAGLMAYLDLNDKMTGADYKQQLLQFQDDNGDGVIDYLEGGKNAGSMAGFEYASVLMSSQADPLQVLKLRFLLAMAPARWTFKKWNTEGLETGEQALVGQAAARAYGMSQAKEEKSDTFYPGRVWGRGKWPSMQYVMHLIQMGRVYGPQLPERINVKMSPYGQAFAYADLKWNGGVYYNQQALEKSQDIITQYQQAVAAGEKPLPFTVYVPHGYGSLEGRQTPNVEETDNPELIFRAIFPDETWGELRLSDFPWLRTIVSDAPVLM